MRARVKIQFTELARLLRGREPVTRFAPSPTGYLHLGHAVHAIYVWATALALGAKIRLRLEDHDQQRCRKEYADAILADLDWLGLLAALPSSSLSHFNRPQEAGVFARQSDHWQRYEEALTELQRKKRLYACRCSRKDLQPALAGEPRGYPGTCRHRNLPFASDVTWRFRLDPDRQQVFHDYFAGDVCQIPSQQGGDFSVRDKNGQFTYQLAVVVDDLHDGVNLIIRGEDLLSSTGRQEALREALGNHPEVVYVHHPLLKEVGTHQKLSKREKSESIASMRAAGARPAQVLARAFSALGLASSGPSPSNIADFVDLLGS